MTSRRTLAVTVAMCAVLAACGQSEQEEPTGATSPTTTPVAATATAAATPTETATSEPAPATETTTGGDSTPTSTPQATQRTNSQQGSGSATGTVSETTPGDYGDAAVTAWAAGDLDTARKYVSSSAASGLGSAPEGELLRVACEGDMCSYTTEAGERVTLTFDLSTVEAGQAGGIVAVKVD